MIQRHRDMIVSVNPKYVPNLGGHGVQLAQQGRELVQIEPFFAVARGRVRRSLPLLLLLHLILLHVDRGPEMKCLDQDEYQHCFAEQGYKGSIYFSMSLDKKIFLCSMRDKTKKFSDIATLLSIGLGRNIRLTSGPQVA